MTARTPSQRRRFLRNFALGGTVASGGSLFPLRAMAHGSFPAGDLHALVNLPHRHKVSFEHGVASGDPLEMLLK